MTDLSIPNSFTSGTSIVAADMNANFDAVETMVNTTGVPVLQDGAVSATAKIADGIVSVAKLDAKPVCLLDKSASQTVGNTFTKITGFSTTLNVQGDHDNVADTITIQTAGLYRISGFATISNGVFLYAAAYVDGSEAVRAAGADGSAKIPVVHFTTIRSLSADQAVTLYAKTDTATVGAVTTCQLSVEYVGAAS